MRRNRILYGGIFLLALCFIYFYGGKVPYMLFYVTILMPVVSFAYTVVIYFRFKYTQYTDKKVVVKGDRVNFIFNVTNEDFLLYPYLKVAFCGAETIFAEQFRMLSFSIAPHKKKAFAFELQCKYRGNYEIGIRSVEIMDLLGIFKLTYRVNEPKVVTVYPKIVQLDSFGLKTDYLSESHSILQSKQEDMSSVVDVRNYSYGDSLKKIHWKLTAKTGEIQVKKFQSTSETSAILLLDLRRNPYSFEQNTIIEDKVIETAVSVLHYCLNHWIPIRLVYYNERIYDIEAKNPLVFDEIYNALAKLRFDQTVSIEDILDVYIGDAISKTNIILFTSNLDYELYDRIYKANSAGFDMSLIYVSPEEATDIKVSEESSILSSLPEIGVNTYKVNINDDIKLVLER